MAWLNPSIIKKSARRPLPSGMGRKRLTFFLVRVGIAITAMEGLAMAVMNPLNGARCRFDVAGTARPNRNPPDIGPRFRAGQRNGSPDDIPGAIASHDAGGFGSLIGEPCPVGSAHLPTVTPHRPDHEGSGPFPHEALWRRQAHTGSIQPMSFGNPPTAPVVLRHSS